MGVVLINSLNEFNGILHANKNVVVDIFASWCGPCKVIKPKFVQLEQKYSKFITFCSVDIDNVNDFAEEYRVNVLPTFLFFLKRCRKFSNGQFHPRRRQKEWTSRQA